MLPHLKPQERIGYALMSFVLLLGVGYVGAQRLRPAAPIVVQPPAPVSPRQDPAPSPAAPPSTTTPEVVTPEPAPPPSQPDPGATPAPRRRKQPAEPVDLNAATEDQLETLPGIGPKTAAAILQYRQEHGPFQTVDELREIHGIGPKKLERIRPWARVGGGLG